MQRESVSTRVSILSRVESGSIDEGPPYPALSPTAYVHVDEPRPVVKPVPDSESIQWPDGTFFPNSIPKVAALDRPTGTINSSTSLDSGVDTRYAVHHDSVLFVCFSGVRCTAALVQTIYT